MTKDQCYEVGYVVKTHGLKGEVGVHLDVDNPAEYQDVEGFLLEKNGELIPYFVEAISILKDKAIIKFEEVNHIDEAKLLVKKTLYLAEDQLDDLDEGQFYYHQIIGYQIVDQNLGVLGIVKDVYDVPPQDLIAMDYQGVEVLIPVSEEHVKTADHSNKTLFVNLPDGLIDVYLDKA
jgi:16S rRNA processing protein RimM